MWVLGVPRLAPHGLAGEVRLELDDLWRKRVKDEVLRLKLAGKEPKAKASKNAAPPVDLDALLGL